MHRYKYSKQLLSCTCIMRTRSIQKSPHNTYTYIVPRVIIIKREGECPIVLCTAVVQLLYGSKVTDIHNLWCNCGKPYNRSTQRACHAAGSCVNCENTCTTRCEYYWPCSNPYNNCTRHYTTVGHLQKRASIC